MSTHVILDPNFNHHLMKIEEHSLNTSCSKENAFFVFDLVGHFYEFKKEEGVLRLRKNPCKFKLVSSALQVCHIKTIGPKLVATM